MKTGSGFLVVALIALSLVLGAVIWRSCVEKPRITTRIEWYEKQIVIPPKTETKPGKTLPPSFETARRDTIILKEPCDSLRGWAVEHSKPFTATYLDTLDVKDSLASFWAQETTTVEVDPWTRIITKTRAVQNAILRAARVTTTETVTAIDWLVTAGALIVGLLVALFLTK
jgi:hypothetical protein